MKQQKPCYKCISAAEGSEPMLKGILTSEYKLEAQPLNYAFWELPSCYLFLIFFQVQEVLPNTVIEHDMCLSGKGEIWI